jgi:hypothetical protein
VAATIARRGQLRISQRKPQLATILGAGAVGSGTAAAGTGGSTAALSSLPLTVALVAKLVLERIEARAAMTLPSAERLLWEDAGASFKTGAIEQDAVNAATAFSDLLIRSIEGDSKVAVLLGVDRSRISQRVRDRSLYASSRSDTRYFQEWQFNDEGTLRGLREVVTAMGEGLHPLVVDHWFTTTSVDLEIGDVPVSPSPGLPPAATRKSQLGSQPTFERAAKAECAGPGAHRQYHDPQQ